MTDSITPAVPLSVEQLVAENARLERKVASLKEQQERDDAEYAEAIRERDRYQLAWKSARRRAQAYGEGILRHVADRDDWKGWCQEAQARVAELERPAVEAKRNEIRSSYSELISQAGQDRDFEGAFDLECQMREREEQWQREDEGASR